MPGRHTWEEDLRSLEGLPEDHRASAIQPMNGKTAFAKSIPTAVTFIVASFRSVVCHTFHFGTLDADGATIPLFFINTKRRLRQREPKAHVLRTDDLRPM